MMIKQKKTSLLFATIIILYPGSQALPMITFDPVALEEGPASPENDIQIWRTTAQKLIQDILNEIDEYMKKKETLDKLNQEKNKLIDSLFLMRQKYPWLLLPTNHAHLTLLYNDRISGLKLNLYSLLKIIRFAGTIPYKLPTTK